ncbi:glycoside hydrolase family 2 protein [Neobacillus mesonae]|nr:glycoside hydrolase family 2 protein [Neobacillus mesonae]
MELSGIWKLMHFEVGEKNPQELAAPGFDDRFWIGATVPGDVHTALVERGIIDPPYFGHNDIKSRWIEQKEWWYRTTFNLDEVSGIGERTELIFEGLDTFAAIFVNGHEIGRTDNMLMSHHFNISRIARKGWNSIAIKFNPLSLLHKDKELFDWSSYTKERPWIRKAAMNFGWDWGPRMVTVGVWGKVHVKQYTKARIEHIQSTTVSASESRAEVHITAAVKTYVKQSNCHISLNLIDHEGRIAAQEELPVSQGSARFKLNVTSPKLWWTHDLGDPYLYRIEMKLYEDDLLLDTYEEALGIRTLELALKDEKGRNSFAFILNGVKIYAKGANWIPADHFIGSIPEQKYRDLIDLAVCGQMNMLRVWAGGIYEKDEFYEACNHRGVLVWQDFAFANALFPDFNRDFMDNVRNEIIDNVLRLRNHPSLVLWCGNNEIDWLYDMKTAGGDIKSPFYGESIYHELIPEILEELDPTRPYWPSSPYGAEGGQDANDPGTGDRHNWQVWHGSVYPRKHGEEPVLDYSIQGVTFKNYKQDYALFSSEFGMHASANRYTLEKNMPEGQFYWGSPEMAYRNKDTNHQKGILLMEGYTGIPSNIEEYMNFSMLTQAEGLKYGIEHFRRNNDRNSGALVWQLNDSWPGTSWAMIDYELLPKASFYYGKRFFNPLLLSLEYEPGDPLRIWIVNDLNKRVSGEVDLKVYTFDGEEVFSASFDAEAEPISSKMCAELSEADVLQGRGPEEVIVELSSRSIDSPVNRYYLRDPKDLALQETQLIVHVDECTSEVAITALNHLARFVKLDLPLGNVKFSDNYFDLLPGEQRVVTISHRHGEPLPWSELRISALNVPAAAASQYKPLL